MPYPFHVGFNTNLQQINLLNLNFDFSLANPSSKIAIYIISEIEQHKKNLFYNDKPNMETTDLAFRFTKEKACLKNQWKIANV